MNVLFHFWCCLYLFIGLHAVNGQSLNIPLIKIIVDSEIVGKDKIPAQIVYASKAENIDVKASIKYRGGHSIVYKKQSFTLELEKKFKLADLPKNDDWILNASYIDKTFMRHKLSYDLFRKMNKNNIAPKCAYVNIEINDEYNGLYVLMEEINAGLIGIDKSDDSALLFKDPPIFYKEKISGIQDTQNYYQQKYPKMEKLDKSKDIEAFKDFLFNSSDDDFAKLIGKWVDLENIMDWHLLLLLTNNSDGVMKNFFLYKLDEKSPFRIAIWDYDHSFGRDGDYEINFMERPIDCNRSILLKRLSTSSTLKYNTKLKEKWLNYKSRNIISESYFKNEILKLKTEIAGEINKNFELWPLNDQWYDDSNDFDQEIDLMLRFIDLRLKQLDDYFIKM